MCSQYVSMVADCRYVYCHCSEASSKLGKTYDLRTIGS